MHGMLSEFTLAELAQLFALSEKSGAIHVTSDEHTSSLVFEAGRIVGWDRDEFHLCQSLEQCRFVQVRETDVLGNVAPDDGNAALATIVRATVDPARWDPFVQRLLESFVYPLLSQESGEFEVETGRPPAPQVPLQLSVQQLILDGSRWEADLNELSHEGYGVGSVWRRYESIPANPNIELSPLDWLIWSDLRSPKSIDVLAAELCYPLLETAEAVKSLYLRRVVDRSENAELA